MGVLLVALFKSVTSNFDRRITNLEIDIKDVRSETKDIRKDISHINSRLGKIEGLLEGYFANAKPR